MSAADPAPAPPPPPAPRPEGATTRRFDLAPGDDFGPYRIVRLLGHGGTSVVYRAEERPLGRHVALKILFPQWETTADFKERFLREAQAAARVFHPNVVALFACGEIAGLLYMAFEFVPGGDLAGSVRDGRRLASGLVLRVLEECVRGLQAISDAGLVHRDIKPHNIYLGEDGQAKLGDLGLARSDTGDDHLTLTGAVLGTPAFMSPEQALGRKRLDIRSDIYSLGATVFTLLTGRLPYEGGSPFAVTYQMLSQQEPPRVRALVPGVAAGLDDLVARMMAREPDDRFRDPGHLLRAIAALRGIGPAVATDRHSRRRPGSLSPVRRWLVRGAAAAAVVGAVLLAWWSFTGPVTPLPGEVAGDPVSAAAPSTWRTASGSDRYGEWFDLILDGESQQRFRRIRAGTFNMGSPENEPGHKVNEYQHAVAINRDFWLADTECRQSLWQAVMGGNPARFQDLPGLPVEEVSWQDAGEFADRLAARLPGAAFRLPTEAEWEFACRAGASGPYGFPCTPETLHRFANHADRSSGLDYADHSRDDGTGDRTAQVGSYLPNAWGLYDMHGNVDEWVADAFTTFLGGVPAADPLVTDGFTRVRRGGSWSALPAELRCAHRIGTQPDNRRNHLGLRLVMEMPPTAPTGRWER